MRQEITRRLCSRRSSRSGNRALHWNVHMILTIELLLAWLALQIPLGIMIGKLLKARLA